MRSIAKSKRQFTLLTLVAALGVAVYLNWEYARGGADSLLGEVPSPDTDAAVSANAEASEPDLLETTASSSGVQSEQSAETPNKNYGDAQLVSVGTEGGSEYFEQARLSRQKSRDDALDTLQKSLKKANLSEEEKAELTARLSMTVENITAESDIENLVKAKGFVDCVAFLDDGKANITVQTGAEGLQKEQVAQIRDIVTSKSSVAAQDITVVEVK